MKLFPLFGGIIFIHIEITQSTMSKKYLLTPEGLEKLNKELKDLVENKRKEVIERIREAAAHGDLSENADYAQAREEQSFIEGRIAEIEDIIKNAEIISQTSHGNIVNVGTTVIVKVSDSEKKYTIVGSNEANPKDGKISNESTVGKALLGRKTGEKFKVLTPAGEIEYQILSIE
jgi:transcription elongation factor GreA